MSTKMGRDYRIELGEWRCDDGTCKKWWYEFEFLVLGGRIQGGGEEEFRISSQGQFIEL